jgi:hypothetical protein
VLLSSIGCEVDWNLGAEGSKLRFELCGGGACRSNSSSRLRIHGAQWRVSLAKLYGSGEFESGGPFVR